MSTWYTGGVPSAHVVGGLRFLPLTVALVQDDYDAFMGSRERLRRWSGSEWPPDTFTVEENAADLQRHDDEHRAGAAYTYSVKDSTTDQVIGCIYLLPREESLRSRRISGAALTERSAGADAGPGAEDVVARGWLRDGLDEEPLIVATLDWLATDWTFPRAWWQSNELFPDQGEICAALGLTRRWVLDPWVFQTRP
jgi:hypothetical protein